MLRLSLTDARRLAVTAQRLDASSSGTMIEIIRALGCLQLDPTSIVARNHLLVLWSRLGSYDRAEFERLMWEERQLFEYWAHAASIVLTEHYPIHAVHMRARHTGASAWAQRMRAWLAENAPLREYILSELEKRGPLQLKSLEGEDRVGMAWQSGGWTSGRTVARMIDELWTEGLVLVYGRSGQARLWHLADRVLPEWTPREALSAREATRAAAQISLRALGVGTVVHIRNHFIRGRYVELPEVLRELESEGVIQRVQIVDGERPLAGIWYLHRDTVPVLERLQAGDWQPRTTLLSPFDNLICDRKRTETLWNFRFRLEIYTPKHQRQYGYFVMPILHGDRLIGRIDPQMDRKAGRLLVHAVDWEPQSDTQLIAERTAAVSRALESLAGWLGAREIVLPAQ